MEEEEGEVMMLMSMKTKAASQEVMVASRREEIGSRGEEEAEARGTSNTWIGGQTLSNIFKIFIITQILSNVWMLTLIPIE